MSTKDPRSVITAAVLFLLVAATTGGCKSLQDDLEQLCAISAEVQRQKVAPDRAAAEIARRFAAYGPSAKGRRVLVAIGAAPARRKVELLRAAAREDGIADWRCPALERLWSRPPEVRSDRHPVTAGGAGASRRPATSKHTRYELPQPSQPSQPLPPGARLIARGSFAPFSVVVDATHVYWSTGDSRLLRTTKDGEDSRGVEQLANAFAIALAVDDRYLYFSGEDQIRRVPKAGGQVQLLARSKRALNMLLDGDRLFWTAGKPRGIHAMDKDGGTVQPVVRTTYAPAELAVDDRFLYYTSYRGNAVMRAAKRGSRPRRLAADQPRPIGLAVDRTHIYWGCEKDRTVRRMAKDRPGEVTIVARDQHNHDIFASDERGVYWYSWAGSRGSHALRRLVKPGGRIATISAALDMPAGIAVDSERIYVSNKGQGTILSFALR